MLMTRLPQQDAHRQQTQYGGSSKRRLHSPPPCMLWTPTCMLMMPPSMSRMSPTDTSLTKSS